MTYFVNKCDYHTGFKFITSKLNDFCKTISARITTNIINTGTDKYDPIKNIKEDTDGNRSKSYSTIINDIKYPNIGLLSYPKILMSEKNGNKRGKTGVSIKNGYDAIRFILSLQEAYLNHIHNPNISIDDVLADVWIDNSYSVEHLFSTKEFTDNDRLSEWSKTKKFNAETPEDFDIIRSSFENLSLLSSNANSRAGTDKMYDKSKVYKNASNITMSNEPELLIASLVKDSVFYQSENIKALDLPDRYITINPDGITWELNDNNRAFNEKLCEMAVEAYFK